MIHPLLPNQLQKTQETMRMAAEFILRPISRKYDKAEHEPPVEMEQLNQAAAAQKKETEMGDCLLYTSPSPRDGLLSRMPSSA